jgi:hypothetical protein
MKPYIDEMLKSLNRSSNSIEKGIKKIEKIIKTIEPSFQQSELITEVTAVQIREEF